MVSMTSVYNGLNGFCSPKSLCVGRVGFGMTGLRGGGDCGERDPAGRFLGHWKVPVFARNSSSSHRILASSDKKGLIKAQTWPLHLYLSLVFCSSTWENLLCHMCSGSEPIHHVAWGPHKSQSDAVMILLKVKALR